MDQSEHLSQEESVTDNPSVIDNPSTDSETNDRPTTAKDESVSTTATALSASVNINTTESFAPIFAPGTYQHLLEVKDLDSSLLEIERIQNDLENSEEPFDEEMDEQLRQDLSEQWERFGRRIFLTLLESMRCKNCGEPPAKNVFHVTPPSFEAKLDNIVQWKPEHEYVSPWEYLENIKEKLNGLEREYWELVLKDGCDDSPTGWFSPRYPVHPE
jgi:hypothetical protein